MIAVIKQNLTISEGTGLGVEASGMASAVSKPSLCRGNAHTSDISHSEALHLGTSIP